MRNRRKVAMTATTRPLRVDLHLGQDRTPTVHRPFFTAAILSVLTATLAGLLLATIGMGAAGLGATAPWTVILAVLGHTLALAATVSSVRPRSPSGTRGRR
jgi:uncharacterized membrane protein